MEDESGTAVIQGTAECLFLQAPVWHTNLHWDHASPQEYSSVILSAWILPFPLIIGLSQVIQDA